MSAAERAELDSTDAEAPSTDVLAALRVVTTLTYEDVYRTDYARMVRVAHMLTGSNEAAEDIVQDAFVQLYPRFGTVGDPGGYLYRSVVNGCWSRNRHRRVVERMRHLTSSSTIAPDGAAELDETWKALERLSPRRRAVIVLRYYADLPLADIGEILGISTGTVKSMIHRALAELKGVIER